MADNEELIAMIAAALAKDKKPKPRKAAKDAAPPVDNINGISIVEDRPMASGKKVSVKEPKRAAPRARHEPETEEAPRTYPAPSRGLALTRTPARPMPHKCNCPLCPLKNE